MNEHWLLGYLSATLLCVVIDIVVVAGSTIPRNLPAWHEETADGMLIKKHGVQFLNKILVMFLSDDDYGV